MPQQVSTLPHQRAGNRQRVSQTIILLPPLTASALCLPEGPWLAGYWPAPPPRCHFLCVSSHDDG